jgi:hypothetical protein
MKHDDLELAWTFWSFSMCIVASIVVVSLSMSSCCTEKYTFRSNSLFLDLSTKITLLRERIKFSKGYYGMMREVKTYALKSLVLFYVHERKGELRRAILGRIEYIIGILCMLKHFILFCN